jgi:hypothetical protein
VRKEIGLWAFEKDCSNRVQAFRLPLVKRFQYGMLCHKAECCLGEHLHKKAPLAAAVLFNLQPFFYSICSNTYKTAGCL